MRPLALLATLVPLALAGCSALRPAAAPAPRSLADRGIALPTGFAYPAHDTLRVVTWNVENLVDGADDPYVDAAWENEGGRDREAKLRRLVEVLRTLDADVVILQEFESSRYLRALAAERFPELGYRWFAGTESPTWYQNVVVMSRLPLGVLRNYAHVHTPVPGIRDSLGRPEVQSQINSRMWLLELFARDGVPLHLAGLHLKAGRSPRDTAMRSGQVRFLQSELATVAPTSAGLLVAGDLNATPGSRELDELIAGAGVGVPLVDPLAGRGVLSHPARNPTRQLDHILLDRRLAARLVPNGVRVAAPLSPAEMGAVSDHLPMLATFVLR
jgi:endonuclease/exonuclease/phosphatase family metal-dependent hydrolase